MKKEYEEPKAEKLEFDYTKAIVASGKKFCVIAGHTVYWEDAAGNKYSQYTPGDE